MCLLLAPTPNTGNAKNTGKRISTLQYPSIRVQNRPIPAYRSMRQLSQERHNMPPSVQARRRTSMPLLVSAEQSQRERLVRPVISAMLASACRTGPSQRLVYRPDRELATMSNPCIACPNRQPHRSIER